jgi:hypothetical protein
MKKYLHHISLVHFIWCLHSFMINIEIHHFFKICNFTTLSILTKNYINLIILGPWFWNGNILLIYLTKMTSFDYLVNVTFNHIKKKMNICNKIDQGIVKYEM